MGVAGRRAILFDLFGTLAHLDPGRLPLLELPEGPVRSTAPGYAALLAELVPGVDLVRFHRALGAVSAEIAAARRTSLREVPSRERFGRALRRLLGDGADVDGPGERLACAHMAQLVDAATVPAAHAPLLARLGRRASLGCVTNFDHAASAHRILERAGLAALLEVVVVSETFGLRKPAAEIFRAALDGLEVSAQAGIFVGDTFDEDVRGAAAAGMRAVWLNPRGEPEPPGAVSHVVIRDLGDVAALVAV
jgi:putative hydrolase of the HAD superfamily